jgi:hypothetical protein
MPLMDDDDMVQTLPVDAPDQPLDVGILPWQPRRDQDLLDTMSRTRRRKAVPSIRSRSRRGSPAAILRQFGQQRFGVLEVGGVKPLRKPAVDRRQ